MIPSEPPSVKHSNSSAPNLQDLEIPTHHPDPDYFSLGNSVEVLSPGRVFVDRKPLMVDLHSFSKTKADKPTSYFRNLMTQIELLDTTH